MLYKFPRRKVRNRNIKKCFIKPCTLALSLILNLDSIHNTFCLDTDVTVFRRCPQIYKPRDNSMKIQSTDIQTDMF